MTRSKPLGSVGLLKEGPLQNVMNLWGQSLEAALGTKVHGIPPLSPL